LAPQKAHGDLHGSYSFYLLIVVLEVSGIMILVVATIRIISQISTGFFLHQVPSTATNAFIGTDSG
jgi:hypothetical protein